jgi:hypothetical protein
MAHFYARRCGEDADDLLQEAWLEILEELPNANLTIARPNSFCCSGRAGACSIASKPLVCVVALRWNWKKASTKQCVPG